MSDQAPWLADNEASRARLQALLARMTEDDMLVDLGDGWTAAAMLAHLAFFDYRLAEIVQRWEAGALMAESPIDLHVINEAKKPLCLAVAPQAAGALALAAAERADAAVARLTAQRPEALAEARKLARLDRANHRDEHTAQIEAALAARG